MNTNLNSRFFVIVSLVISILMSVVFTTPQIVSAKKASAVNNAYTSFSSTSNGWVNTNIWVNKYQEVTVYGVSGCWKMAPNRQCYGLYGVPSTAGQNPCGKIKPEYNNGALLVKQGNTEVNAADTTVIRAESSGYLMLAVNDCWGQFWDNSGNVSAYVSVTASSRYYRIQGVVNFPNLPRWDSFSVGIVGINGTPYTEQWQKLDSGNRFSFDVPFGEYKIWHGDNKPECGYSSKEYSVNPDNNQQSWVFTVDCATYTYEGQVWLNDKPPPYGFEVGIFGNGINKSVVLNAEGKFKFTNLPKGNYTLYHNYNDPTHCDTTPSSNNYFVAVPQVASTNFIIRCDWNSYSIGGTVHTNNVPVSGFGVAIYGIGSTTYGTRWIQTNANGGYVFDGLPRGTYRISHVDNKDKCSYDPATKYRDIDTRLPYANVDFYTTCQVPKYNLTAKVTYNGHAPASDFGLGLDGNGISQIANPDAFGYFTFRDIQEGDYVIRHWHEGCSYYPPEKYVNVHVPSGLSAVEFSITCVSPTPAPDAKYDLLAHVTYNGGAPASDFGLGLDGNGISQIVNPDAFGYFKFTGLPAGDYQVRHWHDWQGCTYEPQSKLATVHVPGGLSAVEFAIDCLPKPTQKYTYVAHVTYNGGAPASDFGLGLSGNGYNFIAYPDSSGNFTFNNVEAGTYNLEHWHTDGNCTYPSGKSQSVTVPQNGTVNFVINCTQPTPMPTATPSPEPTVVPTGTPGQNECNLGLSHFDSGKNNVLHGAVILPDKSIEIKQSIGVVGEYCKDASLALESDGGGLEIALKYRGGKLIAIDNQGNISYGYEGELKNGSVSHKTKPNLDGSLEIVDTTTGNFYKNGQLNLAIEVETVQKVTVKGSYLSPLYLFAIGTLVKQAVDTISRNSVRLGLAFDGVFAFANAMLQIVTGEFCRNHPDYCSSTGALSAQGAYDNLSAQNGENTPTIEINAFQRFYSGTLGTELFVLNVTTDTLQEGQLNAINVSTGAFQHEKEANFYIFQLDTDVYRYFGNKVTNSSGTIKEMFQLDASLKSGDYVLIAVNTKSFRSQIESGINFETSKFKFGTKYIRITPKHVYSLFLPTMQK